MAKLAYYGDSISPNMIKTPSGVLICKNVPIGRVGQMDYLAGELGLKDTVPDMVVSVYRTDSEVFNAATLASFEGVSVTDGHPPDDVEPSNWANYSKGHVQNVRRGTESDTDKIVADLFITDPTLIDEVENKIKRQVSSGYNCVYLPGEGGKIFQSQIRGNHVAVVDEGRAGESVCINDSVPKAVSKTLIQERSKPLMSNNAKKISGILNLFARSARDAKTTDELADLAKDAVEAIDNAVTEDPPSGAGETESAEVADQAFEGAGELLAAIKALTVAVSSLGSNAGVSGDAEPCGGGENETGELVQALRDLIAGAKGSGEDSDPIEDPPKATEDDDDPIAALIEALTDEDPDIDGDPAVDEDLAEQEEALTVNAETMDTDNSELEAAAKDAAVAILKNARPAIAQIKDPAERKRVTDALLKSVKGQIATSKKRGVADIMSATAKAAQKRATDSAKRPGTFDLEAQQAAYDKHNPHIKKEVK